MSPACKLARRPGCWLGGLLKVAHPLRQAALETTSGLLTGCRWLEERQSSNTGDSCKSGRLTSEDEDTSLAADRQAKWVWQVSRLDGSLGSKLPDRLQMAGGRLQVGLYRELI